MTKETKVDLFKRYNEDPLNYMRVLRGYPGNHPLDANATDGEIYEKIHDGSVSTRRAGMVHNYGKESTEFRPRSEV